MKRILVITTFSLSFTQFSFSQDVEKIKITDLEKIIKESTTPLIVNFWGTYCLPCIEEIPYFESMTKKFEKDSVRLLLVSLDFRDDYARVGPFAAKRKFTAPVVWLDETNADYFCPKVDPKWTGSIPSSLFINNKTGYRKFYEKQLTEDEFEKEIMAILGKN